MTTLAAQYAPLAYPAVVYGLGIALSAAVAFAVVGAIVGRLMDHRTRDHQLDDEIAALDHGEPSRAAVERAAMDALARAEADRNLERIQDATLAAFEQAMALGNDTPIFDGLQAETFERDALAEIEEITRRGAS